MKRVAAGCHHAIIRAFNIFKTNRATHKWKLVNPFKSEYFPIYYLSGKTTSQVWFLFLALDAAFNYRRRHAQYFRVLINKIIDEDE